MRIICNKDSFEHLLMSTFFFFLLQQFYIVFDTIYGIICKDLQKMIVLSSDPFMQIFTFTIQCIRNLFGNIRNRVVFMNVCGNGTFILAEIGGISMTWYTEYTGHFCFLFYA